MNLEIMNFVHAAIVGSAFATLGQETTGQKRWVYGALVAVAALFGLGDELLMYGVVFSIAGAVPRPPRSPRNMMILAALTLPFLLALPREPLPWDDLRVWVWPVVALLTAAGLRKARPGVDQPGTEAVQAE